MTSTDNRPPEAISLRSRILTRVLHVYFGMSRGMTMGVRAACFDAEGRVFLVRHTYLPGWYLPGGGIERGETTAMALEKELREEGNLVLTEPPELFQIYFNNLATSRDHVVLYRARVTQTGLRKPDHEIAESGFFDPENLPEGTTPATLRRLSELRGEVKPADYW
jgi:8-oxo-dGTP pyrophosphatase MutT (NUDIX family)